jgi:hypothetical protein
LLEPGSSRPAWVTKQEPISKQTNKQTKKPKKYYRQPGKQEKVQGNSCQNKAENKAAVEVWRWNQDEALPRSGTAESEWPLSPW